MINRSAKSSIDNALSWAGWVYLILGFGFLIHADFCPGVVLLRN